jgi:hypothetical protein
MTPSTAGFRWLMMAQQPLSPSPTENDEVLMMRRSTLVEFYVF